MGTSDLEEKGEGEVRHITSGLKERGGEVGHIISGLKGRLGTRLGTSHQA